MKSFLVGAECVSEVSVVRGVRKSDEKLVRQSVLQQGTTLVVPQNKQKHSGFSPCKTTYN
jgi:hypothetical protein